MNYLQKKILTIAAGIANIALSLAVAATATFAWFSAQTQVTAEALNISCSAPESTLQYKVLSYNYDNKEGKGFENDSTKFFLQPYDRFVPNKNKYSNVIVRAVVDVSKLNYTDANQICIDIECTDAGNFTYNDITNVAGVPSYSSNVAQFKSCVAAYSLKNNPDTFVQTGVVSAIHDEAISNSYDSDDEYTTATNYFANIDFANKFVTLHNETPNKRYNKTTVIPKFNCGANPIGKIVVYLEASYNPELVDYYTKTQPNLPDEIKLTKDLKSIIFAPERPSYKGAYVRVDDNPTLTTHNVSHKLADGVTDSTTTSDALIVNESHKDTFDSTNPSSDWNYRDFRNSAARIENDYNTFNSRWNYNGSSLKSKTPTGDSYEVSGGVSFNYNTTDNCSEITSNTQKLQYDNAEGETSFGYSASKKDEIQVYKYDYNAETDLTLDRIVLGGITNNEDYGYLNSEFTFNGTVTAYYKNGLDQDAATVDVTDYCSFTGYDMSAKTNQEVTVAYVENGVQKTTSYTLHVVDTPYLTVDFPRLTGTAGGNTTNTIFSHEFRDSTVDFTWTSGNNSVATVTNKTVSNKNATAQINFIAAGSTTITVSAIGHNTRETCNDVTFTVTVGSSGTKVDEITRATTEVTGTSYVAWSGKTPSNTNHSNAVYAGQSAGGNDSIQLRSTNSNSGVICTTSGGKLVSIKIEWDSNTDPARVANIYAKTSAYTDATDLYSNSSAVQGTRVAQLTYTSSGATYTFDANDDYTYFGIRSNSGAQYISKITITWSTGSSVSKQLAKITLDDITDEYNKGDAFVNPSITAWYSDKTSAIIDAADCEITGYDAENPGTQEITVSYTESGIEATAKYSVVVHDVYLTSFEFSGQKMSFFVGDTFTTGTSFSVIAYYSDGGSKDVTNRVTVTGPTSQQMAVANTNPGYKVTVSYREGNVSLTDDYYIKVSTIAITSIAVTTMPTKTIYHVNDIFNPAGMVVTGVYSNGTTTTISNSELIYKTTALTTADKSFQIALADNTDVKTTISLTINGARATLNTYSLSGVAGATGTNVLTATGHDFEGSITGYTWHTSDPDVVTISGSGATVSLNYVGEGSATVYCTVTDGTESPDTPTCTVTVSAFYLHLKQNSSNIERTTISMIVGDTATFSVDTNGVYSSYSATNNSGSNVSISYSNGTFTVTALKATANNVRITVTVNVGNTPHTEYVDIQVTALTVSLNSTANMSISGTNSGTRTATTNKSGATITATSSNNSAATVTATSTSDTTATITVTGVAAGNATISVKATNGGKDSVAVTFNVTVTGSSSTQKTYSITTKTSGTTTWSGGNNVDFTVTGTYQAAAYLHIKTTSTYVYNKTNIKIDYSKYTSTKISFTVKAGYYGGKAASVYVQLFNSNGTAISNKVTAQPTSNSEASYTIEVTPTVSTATLTQIRIGMSGGTNNSKYIRFYGFTLSNVWVAS